MGFAWPVRPERSIHDALLLQKVRVWCRPVRFGFTYFANPLSVDSVDWQLLGIEHCSPTAPAVLATRACHSANVRLWSRPLSAFHSAFSPRRSRRILSQQLCRAIAATIPSAIAVLCAVSCALWWRNKTVKLRIRFGSSTSSFNSSPIQSGDAVFPFRFRDFR